MYGVLQTEGVESLAMEHPAPAAAGHANYYSRTPPSPRGACLQYSAVHHSAPSICAPAQPPPPHPPPPLPVAKCPRHGGGGGGAKLAVESGGQGPRSPSRSKVRDTKEIMKKRRERAICVVGWQVSQCPEKAPLATRALLKAPSITFTIKYLV